MPTRTGGGKSTRRRKKKNTRTSGNVDGRHIKNTTFKVEDQTLVEAVDHSLLGNKAHRVKKGA